MSRNRTVIQHIFDPGRNVSDNTINDYLMHYQKPRQTACLIRNTSLHGILNNLYPNVDIKEAAYLYVNDIAKRPICAYCKGPTTWHKNKYAECCSTRCANYLKDNMGLCLKSVKEKFGVDSIAHIPGVSEKRTKTNIERYGAKISPKTVDAIKSRTSQLNVKGRDTIKKRYGVDHPSQIPGAMEKGLETKIKRYGRVQFIDRATPEQELTKYQSMVPASIVISSVEAPIDGQSCYRFKCLCKCGHVDVHSSETIKWRLKKTGTTCTKCSKISTSRSLKEADISEAVTLMTDYEVLSNDRRLINPYELDIVIPELKLAIEFCGLYWHRSTKIGEDYHLNKMRKVNDKEFRLITIFEDEYDHGRDDVLLRLSRIIDGSENEYLESQLKRNPLWRSESYIVDNRWDDGLWLKSHGFKLVEFIDPISYEYDAKLSKRNPITAFTKPEKIIHDCGHTKWVWVNDLEK